MRLATPIRCVAFALSMMGCAGATVPAARVASAEAAVRAADEVGAERNPRAQLHLRLAREQIGLAQSMARDGNAEEAARMYQRARIDAELALALTRESGANARADAAQARARAAEGGAP